MEQINQLLLSRILSGYHVFSFRNIKLRLQYPDSILKYQAEIFAADEMKKNRFSEWLKSEDILSLLINQGVWGHQEEEFLKNCEKTTENLKIDIYKNFRNPKSLKLYKKKLKAHNRTHSFLLNKRHSFDHITLEGYCEQIKSNYLLERSVYDEHGNLFLMQNSQLVDDVSNVVSGTNISMSKFRELARSPQWAYYWHSQKSDSLFGVPIKEWTDEQRLLVSMSRMYDNAREHPESPDDDVFEDDDAFDGWSISERRKQEKEKSKNRAEKMLPGKLKDAQEIYVMANNPSEAKDINNLNDGNMSMIVQERKKFVQKYGKVKESNLPDVQRDLIINSNKQGSAKRGNG